jgi:hypothetical protein
MQTVVETPVFQRRADKLLSTEERRSLIDFLAWNPDAGQEIPGTGGVRKLRYAAQGKGRSGGVRVIYFVVGETMPIYALLIYGKGEQADLSSEQRRKIKALAQDLKAGAKADGSSR